jgi:DNA-binding NarL/FixJ family response regulator
MLNVAFIEADVAFLQKMQKTIQLQPGLRCLSAANSVESFFENFPTRGTLDVLFSDIQLPGKSGIEALPVLRKRFPKAEIIMLTQLEDPALLFQALSAGATGYLLKDFPVLKITAYIQSLIQGQALISPKMARHLINYFRPVQVSENSKLNAKETQMLLLFGDGKSYKETAEILDMTVDGVKYYVKRIYSKLGVSNKIDAIRLVQSSQFAASFA